MNASIRKILSLLILLAFVGHVAEVFLATISIAGSKTVAASEQQAESTAARHSDSSVRGAAVLSAGLSEAHFCDTVLHVLCCHQNHQFLTSNGAKWVVKNEQTRFERRYFSETSFPAEIGSRPETSPFIPSIFHPPCYS